ncbi:tRNA 2-selenouridine(34) synthase MnmH [Undibacterium sp. LFS511W]|uniref:tRNA 2-selenouridine(34) synthase MnmH n=2 Tax=Undibacterium luofuense TaxID=2828733 RepID=A0A941I8Q7_9BURK|nr:tRNA 2-selenouridine(34) synthase MnmH [Undibacterium luofuense]
MKYPELLTLEETLAQLDQFDGIIDARSPAEYAEDHLPGAINLPVLDNEERIRIGTMYKQTGAFEAKRLGAALVAANIARHLENQLQDKPREWRPLIYCWRGGNRSGSMAHIFARIGWPVAQLQGGYQSFRRRVHAELPQLVSQVSWKVICGPTGSGKSALLETLAAQGAPVLDLEQLASHRGSLLGALPGTVQPSQKQFESQIWLRLKQAAGKTLYVESESKKVGNLRVPDCVMEAIRAAECVFIEAPFEERVRFLCDSYPHWMQQPDVLCERLSHLAVQHGNQQVQVWKEMVQQAAFRELTASLLEQHYDPSYRKSMAKNFGKLQTARTISLADLQADSLQSAAMQLIHQS